MYPEKETTICEANNRDIGLICMRVPVFLFLFLTARWPELLFYKSAIYSALVSCLHNYCFFTFQ